MGAPKTLPPRHRLGAVAASALAVVAIMAGAFAVRLAAPDPDAAPPDPAQLSSVDEGTVLDLDLGPATDPEGYAACIAGGFAPDMSSIDVLYTVLQRSADGSSPVLLLRNAAGSLRLCDAAGPDSPARLPLPVATADDPVAFLSNGRMSWDCSGTTVDGFTSTTWLAVASVVDLVQQRFWVDGVPGPWFSSQAHDGYAHVQAWLEGPLPAETQLAVQHRVLDADGYPISQNALPSQRQPLLGCTGDDVEIG